MMETFTEQNFRYTTVQNIYRTKF